MKCINCGANYETIETKCPYCGTINEKGLSWNQDEQDAKNNMEKTRSYIIRSMPLYIWNYVCNIILGITIVLIIVFNVLLNIEGSNKNKKEPDLKKVDFEYLEQCYQNDNYYDLITYMNEKNLRNSKDDRLKKYDEYLNIYNCFDEFYEDLERYYMSSQKNIEENCNYGVVYNLVEACSDFLSKDFDWKYRRGEKIFEPENQIIFDNDQEIIYAFLKSDFMFSEEECLELGLTNVYGDECKEYVKSIYERKGWKYTDEK